MQKAPHVVEHLSRYAGEDAFQSLEGYRAQGGYGAARRALGKMSPAAIRDEITASGLRGRGGAGFSAGAKWGFMPGEGSGPHYLVCNADESEPGSFKDRILLERGAHQLIDGILIAAWATGAEKTFVYIRGEYGFPARQLQRCIDEAYDRGYLGANVMKTTSGRPGSPHRRGPAGPKPSAPRWSRPASSL